MISDERVWMLRCLNVNTHRCPLRGLALLVVSLARSAVPAAEPAREIGPAPVIGMWYTVWWTKDDQFKHWVNCHVFPTRGPYTAGDPQVISDHYAQLRDLGVDFLIMDDTNGAGNDGSRINDNIRAWFDLMDRLAPTERILICIGGGGEMRGEGAKGQSRAADFYWHAWAQRPGYFHLDGKQFIHQAAMPKRAAIILTPTGMLDRMRSRQSPNPASSRPQSEYWPAYNRGISSSGSGRHEQAPVRHVAGVAGR